MKRLMFNFSYWEQKHFWHSWDFTIVGSGITGLTTAIYIKKIRPQATVAILERGLLPTGASTKNAGFACFGSLTELLDDLNNMTRDDVFSLVSQRLEGVKALRALVGDKDCGYIDSGGFEIFTNGYSPADTDLHDRMNGLNKELKSAVGLDFFEPASHRISEFGLRGVDELICNKLEGTIDTGLMMKNLIGMARGLGIEIFNGVPVTAIETESERPTIHTESGSFSTGCAIVATNGLTQKLLPSLDVTPARAQVLVTSPIKHLKIKGCFHHHLGYDYFRNVDGRILLGGGRHINKASENTDELRTTEEIQAYLESLLRDHILPEQDFTIDHRWSGIMGVGSSKKIILERLGRSTLCAVRFGGMGIAIGTYIGKKVAESVT